MNMALTNNFSAPFVKGPSGDNRLKLQHGPIDLIIEAYGRASKVERAFRQAEQRFSTILQQLVDELPLLRKPLSENTPGPEGDVARAMCTAIAPHHTRFITPMAAVAGSVADEMLTAMVAGCELDKAYVNNGGDMAIYFDDGRQQSFNIAIVADPRSGQLASRATIDSNSPIRGIATSGRHGRSHSLGIADSVTVFASNAAAADAAATMIANAVDLPDNPAITRRPAIELAPDSDLGNRLVTTDVARLNHQEISKALDAGEIYSRQLCDSGTIEAAFLCLQSAQRLVGTAFEAPANLLSSDLINRDNHA